MISGLQGGHSGDDIDKGRANANVLMGKLLSELSPVNCQLGAIEGGSKRNAIPRESKAVLLFAEGELDSVSSIVEKAENDFKTEYPNDSGIKITLDKTETPDTMMTIETTKTIIDAITRITNGVYSMSEHMPKPVYDPKTGDSLVLYSKTSMAGSLWQTASGYTNNSVIAFRIHHGGEWLIDLEDYTPAELENIPPDYHEAFTNAAKGQRFLSSVVNAPGYQIKNAGGRAVRRGG